MPMLITERPGNGWLIDWSIDDLSQIEWDWWFHYNLGSFIERFTFKWYRKLSMVRYWWFDDVRSACPCPCHCPCKCIHTHNLKWLMDRHADWLTDMRTRWPTCADWLTDMRGLDSLCQLVCRSVGLLVSWLVSCSVAQFQRRLVHLMKGLLMLDLPFELLPLLTLKRLSEGVYRSRVSGLVFLFSSFLFALRWDFCDKMEW